VILLEVLVDYPIAQARFIRNGIVARFNGEASAICSSTYGICTASRGITGDA